MGGAGVRGKIQDLGREASRPRLFQVPTSLNSGLKSGVSFRVSLREGSDRPTWSTSYLVMPPSPWSGPTPTPRSLIGILPPTFIQVLLGSSRELGRVPVPEMSFTCQVLGMTHVTSTVPGEEVGGRR